MFLLCTGQVYSQAPFPILYPSFFSVVSVLYVLYSTVQCTALHPNSTSQGLTYTLISQRLLHLLFLEVCNLLMRKISFGVL